MSTIEIDRTHTRRIGNYLHAATVPGVMHQDHHPSMNHHNRRRQSLLVCSFYPGACTRRVQKATRPVMNWVLTPANTSAWEKRWHEKSKMWFYYNSTTNQVGGLAVAGQMQMQLVVNGARYNRVSVFSSKRTLFEWRNSIAQYFRNAVLVAIVPVGYLDHDSIDRVAVSSF